ncbi:hypothetical protein I6A60_35025 [Frankia sp. AgB1.9]|uniref:hypothetical protein n=1 Tax=unclassified Frankia TaxID=2632575 RepID=UPI001932E0C4|nr:MULTISPECIES: hypothetical protein [unclassified Frankia]MBL7493688.1 hypothetical protein [Frankia sp. AgW1.1]MBL7553027.1 hypothetical protein [Frankia sp. AgB1.9]MBL7621580.1 hypothetical protein [Frankia sp. AgB1.8]
MPDQALLPPVPAPRQAATKTERLLSERLFLFVSPRTPSIPTIGPQLHHEHGGLAVCRFDDLQKGGQLALARYQGPLLLDPGHYEKQVATSGQPFIVPPDDMYGSGLERELDLQVERRAIAAITPTGYIRAADWDALKAIVHAAQELQRSDVTVMLPIDAAWLRDDWIEKLDRAIKNIPHPVAIAVGGQFNPFDRYKKATTNLRRLLIDNPRVGLWRSDLQVIDAIGHGALFAAFGLSGSLRHTVPPGQPAESKNRGGPPAATVLLPEFLRFSKGPDLAQVYANTDAPTCDCSACDGARLDRFDGFDNEIRALADSHNAAVWTELVVAVFRYTDLGSRQAWWHRLASDAREAIGAENERLRQAGAFKIPEDLARWADLSVTHEPAAMSSPARRT